jgi:chromosome segregation ATPase
MPSGLLGLFGLARHSQVRAAKERVTELKRRSDEAAVRLESSRLDAERWKWKHEQLGTQLKAATKDAERWKTKTEGQNELLAKLRRLDAAEKKVDLAREHLFGMETKLDVIEAAINILDRRTRDRGAGPSPDPVPADLPASSHRE